MSKRLILVLALVFAVGITAAHAEVQNVKVSGDIFVTGIVRDNLNLHDDATVAEGNPARADFGEDIDAWISQVRLRVDADLTDNVSATIRLLNERAWGDEADANNITSRINNSDVSLDLAYVTLKEFLYSPLTVRIGRQNLRYGNGLIIGDPDTNGVADGHGSVARYLPNSLDDLSVRKSFDAFRAILDYDPLVVDLVYSKIDENNVAFRDDTELIGANAAYQFDKDLLGELYFWQRGREAFGVTGAILMNSQTEYLRTLGARGLYTGLENFVLSLEGAFQFGDHANSALLYPNDEASMSAATGRNRKVTAYAIQAVVNYARPDKKYAPQIGGSYSYLSGDDYLSTSDTYRGWDPMYEDQAAGTLFNKIFGYSNAQLFNVNGSIVPIDDITVALNYYYLRLNENFSATAMPVVLTGVVGDPQYHMTAAHSLGHEIDLGVTYDYTEDVQFGLNTGAFIPGEAFNDRNVKTARQFIGSMKVSF